LKLNSPTVWKREEQGFNGGKLVQSMQYMCGVITVKPLMLMYTNLKFKMFGN
jgi:hypothetical protein